MSESLNGGKGKAPATSGSAEASSKPSPAAAAKDGGAKAAAPDAAPKKLSGAELKKQKQAEKQAKRAQQKAAGPSSTPLKGPAPKEGNKTYKDDKSKALPTRRRPSQPHIQPPKELKKEIKEPKQEKKKTGLFFGHLYTQPRQHSLVGATKDVHPAVLALGLQYSSYVICGSTARMVAMLLTFKAVIEEYQTPPGTSLARHLTSHHLSPQIDYLRSCRPLSISMGNAIRWLKDVIIKIDPQMPEEEAKRELTAAIDMFIETHVSTADQIIAQKGADKIVDGDVVLTFASSSIVEKAILLAHRQRKNFSVIVVDSKPLFEGKRLARKLANAGVPVKYFLITGASHAVKQATKVFLGAHAMMSNGRLYSRVGTAVVSMLAYAQSIPVLVLCESIKFTERVALDSIVGNEVAPSEEILSQEEREVMVGLKPYLPQALQNKLPKSEDDEEKKDKKARPEDVLKWIESSGNLQMLQVLYDVTPAEFIHLVITEHGGLPPTSVPVVHRQAMESTTSTKK